MAEYSRKIAERTMGLDLGDKYSHSCVIDREGEAIETGRIATRATGQRGGAEKLLAGRSLYKQMGPNGAIVFD